MNHLGQRIYPYLPPVGRSLAASARGLQLRATRYDRDLSDRVDAASEREYWNAEQWDELYLRSLQDLFDAARETDHYRPLLDRLTDPGDGWESMLVDVALLPKATLRDHPERFRSGRTEGQRLVAEATSGTTGTPLELSFSSEAVRAWFALFEARVRRWHGVDLGDRWAMFGGQLVVPVTRQEPPFWVHNWPMHQLYVSTHHLARENVVPMARALRRFGPQWVLGYPSSLALFARMALEDGVELPQPRVVVSNAEPLEPAQREVIAEAFRCPVRNTYGMAEQAAGASECEAGTMHLWPEAGIVEVATAGGSISRVPGDRGPLLLTGLLNHAQPLLRYDVGDRGSVPTPSACPCGRTLPVMGAIEGRSSDLLVTPEGRQVFWINPIFRDLPVAESQVIQHAVDDVEIRVVGRPTEWTRRHGDVLVDRLRERMGPRVDIRVSEVAAIERDPSGKFRSVVSHVSKALR